MSSSPLEDLIRALREHGLMLAVAESCTGGLLGATITRLPGVSDVFAGGFITYSNAMKQQALGVPETLLAMHGAVSAECAAAMTEGVLTHSEAGLALSLTGIAGPDGGSPAKPVGLVYIGGQLKGRQAIVERHVFTGDRQAVREQAVATAISLALRLLHQAETP